MVYLLKSVIFHGYVKYPDGNRKKTDSMKVPYIYTEREDNMVFDKGSIYLSLDDN